MAEYHVGCGITGIFAGTVNKKGNMWINKSDVTQEVLNAAFDYLFVNEKEIKATVDGKSYAMRIVPIIEADNVESEEKK